MTSRIDYASLPGTKSEPSGTLLPENPWLIVFASFGDLHELLRPGSLVVRLDECLAHAQAFAQISDLRLVQWRLATIAWPGGERRALIDGMAAHVAHAALPLAPPARNP